MGRDGNRMFVSFSRAKGERQQNGSVWIGTWHHPSPQPKLFFILFF
jgi:hypothetical protein